MVQGTTNHVMQCMEVWGGNRAIDNGVVMSGLDAWVYCQPYKAIDAASGGGDIHYVSSCASGQITRMLIADVSGHGAPVAKAADALRRLMSKFSNYVDQSRFLEAVNTRFGELSAGASETEAGDDGGAMFATAIAATYFTPTDELSICIAGHPRPMRYDAGVGRWVLIVPDANKSEPGPRDLPLGVLDPVRYTVTRVRLGRDDLVLFYTDALIEALGPDGRQLGERGVLEILNTLDAARHATLVGRLLREIAARSPRGADAAFDDDVTALLVRRNDLKPRPSMGLSLRSGWNILRHAAGSLVPGALPASFPEFGLGPLRRVLLRGSERDQAEDAGPRV